MYDLKDLYQDIILDHNRHPHNHHAMDDATVQAQGFNPVCGDKLTVYLKVSDDIVQDVSFIGCGCAISQASASLMTDAIKNKKVTEVHQLFTRFHDMLTNEHASVERSNLDKLSALAGVRAFPVRVKCATLAWHTMEAALDKKQAVVTTE